MDYDKLFEDYLNKRFPAEPEEVKKWRGNQKSKIYSLEDINASIKKLIESTIINPERRPTGFDISKHYLVMLFWPPYWFKRNPRS